MLASINCSVVFPGEAELYFDAVAVRAFPPRPRVGRGGAHHAGFGLHSCGTPLSTCGFWRRQAGERPDGETTVFRARRRLCRGAGRFAQVRMMAFSLDHVREIAERVAQSSGLILWEVEMKRAGTIRTLRIFIDRRPEGITHEDCAKFTREVSTIFDVEDAVPGGPYVLEVSSPGLDRRLFKPEHFAEFVGSLVKLTTRQPREGSRNFEGRLKAFDGQQLTVDLDEVGSRKKAKAQGGGVLILPFAEVEKANLVPEI